MIANRTLVPALLVSAGSFAGVAQAGEVVLNFNDLKHGEILKSDRYADKGVTIHTENYHSKWDIGAGFDTNERWTRDWDLQSPFDHGNAKSEDFGTALIIQENIYWDWKNGVLKHPDDQAGSPAGYFKFDFDVPVSHFGMSVIDIDGKKEAKKGYILSVERGEQRVKVGFGDFVDPNSMWYDPTVKFGNNSANHLPMLSAKDLGLDGIDRIKVVMGGSGAIDNVKFKAVPSPSAAIGGLGMLGLAAARRRRREA
ncbi:MAG: hypothetical protein AAF288_02960 [Planctomycetota bacterium]